jgi:hypothetical protein
MRTTLKQLKVINNAQLSADGTFSIGLRDNLVIKPNSKVGLSKFLCKELTDQSFTLKTDDGFPARSLPTPLRTITVPKGVYTQRDLMSIMNKACNTSLVCGDLTGGNTFTSFVSQSSTSPTIDAGLDIEFQPATDGGLSFKFTSRKLSMVFDDVNGAIATPFGVNLVNIGGVDNNVGMVPQELDSYWGYAGQNPIVKGAYQAYIQLVQMGKVGVDWYWGLRFLDDATENNTDSVVCGIHRRADGTWELVDTDVLTGQRVFIPITYTWSAGDFFILFSANGQLQLQIYAGDPTTLDGIGGVLGLKYNSITDLTLGFTIYKDVLQSPNVNFRSVVAKGVNNSLLLEPTDAPAYRMLWSCDRATLPLGQGQPRIITLDFSQSGDLIAQLGLATSILQSPTYQIITTFTGVATSTITKVQDLAIYWSLPCHTYVASQDRRKVGRENMIASFTPYRTANTTDNLFFQEEIAFTDIGNLETMNISTLQFRVINLYDNYNNPLKTTYLSFVLFIQEEF